MADRPNLITKSSGLQEIFEAILGSKNVYYQPPTSVKMKYPAIRYKRNPIKKRFADNMAYSHLHSYDVTLIDTDPDSNFVEEILKLPFCQHDSNYVADNLHHDKFTIYY